MGDLAMKDWRLDFIVCRHVAEDQRLGTQRSGFRVCCNRCAPDFLTVERLRLVTRPDNLCVGEVVA